MPPLLDVSDLSKRFDPALPPVFQGVSFSVAAGEAVALTGESGSGKSTLLHLVAGLDAPDHGRIRIDGAEIDALDEPGRAALRREKIGIVFQQFNLIPSLSVASNIGFQARLADRFDAAWAQTLAEILGLDALLDRYPEQLSGGQQQRVAIGRALAGRPGLVLADEPTGNLDEATGDAVMQSFRRLIEETGAALLMVTHSERLANGLDRRLRLSRGVVA
ncbi:MAG: ABC transporter ATP-binding protein [Pseudomonadota bacterium]